MWLAIVLIDPDLDNPKQSTPTHFPLPDTFLDQLPLLVGQMRVVACRVADPAVLWFHTAILNQHPDADHPRFAGLGHHQMGRAIQTTKG